MPSRYCQPLEASFSVTMVLRKCRMDNSIQLLYHHSTFRIYLRSGLILLMYCNVALLNVDWQISVLKQASNAAATRETEIVEQLKRDHATELRLLRDEMKMAADDYCKKITEYELLNRNQVTSLTAEHAKHIQASILLFYSRFFHSIFLHCYSFLLYVKTRKKWR